MSAWATRSLPYNCLQVRSGPFNAGLGLLLLALGTLGAASSGTEEPVLMEREIRRFLQVFSLLDQQLAEPFDAAEAIYQGALPAMLRTLDPHSAFVEPSSCYQASDYWLPPAWQVLG